VRICLVGYSTTGLLGGPTGGSERQVALLARELATRGHDVALVVTGLHEPEGEVAGVRVRSGWDPDRGVRWARAITYRYPHLYRALRDERADVYYTRGGQYFTPLVMAAARAVGAQALLALASDGDLYPAAGRVLFDVGNARVSRLIGPPVHAVYRRWGLRKANWVVAQNAEQAEACAAMGLSSAIVPNIVEPPPAEVVSIEPRRDVVWVGNVLDGRRSKGIDELLLLAQLLPEVGFTVVGRLRSQEHATAIARLAALANVEVTGPLSHGETLRRIAGHRLVINTSPSEGFSNVMLEGWSLGRPAVSLASDPSRLLGEGRLGFCAGGAVETMAAGIAALLAEDDARLSMGRRCREYVAALHAPEKACVALERLVAGAST
jgi:glycosyltransferase involved in cell wall biosynthesis